MALFCRSLTQRDTSPIGGKADAASPLLRLPLLTLSSPEQLQHLLTREGAKSYAKPDRTKRVSRQPRHSMRFDKL